MARRIMKTHCANLLEAQEGAIEALRRSLKGNADPKALGNTIRAVQETRLTVRQEVQTRLFEPDMILAGRRVKKLKK